MTNIPAENIVALLPLKLETKFKRDADGGVDTNILRIRVYPDPIAINAHRRALSPAEQQAKKEFYAYVEDAENPGNFEDRRRAAWRRLCGLFGAERAAWIVREGVNDAGFSADWKPSVQVLPKQLTFYLRLKGKDNEGKDIREDFTIKSANIGSLTIDPLEDGNWMIDFDEAKDKGMAVEVNLKNKWSLWNDPTITEKEVEHIVVVGVKEDTNGQQQLAELFEQHRYTKGLEFIPPGTPTNNTSEGASGFSSEKDTEASYDLVFMNPDVAHSTDPYKKSDRQLLAEALGIDLSVFDQVKGRDDRSRSHAKAMNTALWPATLGYYLEELFNSYEGPVAHLLSSPDEENYLKALDWGRKVFIEHIIGRGSLPTVRVGKQPYGFLPMSVMKSTEDRTIVKSYEWEPPYLQKTIATNGGELIYDYGGEGQIFEKNLTRFLQNLEEDWSTRFSYLDRHIYAAKESDFNERFMHILGLQSHSVAFQGRLLITARRLPNFIDIEQDKLDENEAHFSNFVKERGFKLNYKISEVFPRPETYGILQLHNIRPENSETDTIKLNKGLVANENSEVSGLTKDIAITINFTNSRGHLTSYTQHMNYIQYLSYLGLNDIPTMIKEMRGVEEEIVEEKANTVCYFMLRTAMLNQYWDAAMRIFEKIELRDFRIRGMLQHEEVRESSSNLIDFVEQEFDKSFQFEKLKTLLKIDNNERHFNFDQIANDSDIDPQWSDFFGYFLPDYFSENGGGELDILTPSTLAENWKEKLINRANYKNFIIGVNLPRWDSNYSWERYMTDTGREALPGNALKLQINANKLSFLLLESNGNDLSGINTNTSIPMWKYVNGLTTGRRYFPDEIRPLTEFKNALNAIEELPTAELERLLAEHIDLCTYRLDAWWLGLVNKRLAEIRSKEAEITNSVSTNRNNTFIGAYGYVENLKPTTTSTSKQGFVHAPSLGQATAAAILRSGFEATGDNSAAAVNLSSQRVKTALYYLEGMREGQSIGALLGYKFERYLREQQLEGYLLKFREAHTLTNGNTNSSYSPNLAQLDGKKLIANGIDFNQLRPTPDEKVLMEKGKEQLLDDLDAVGDVLLAESVYQSSMGNYERANAAISVINEGGLPPEIEFVKTPRQGNDLTHRVCIQWKMVSSNTRPNSWKMDMSPRAMAEPSFNYWLGELIGNPEDVACLVRHKELESARSTTTITLAELGLQPIDVYCLMNEEGQPELLARILAKARQKMSEVLDQTIQDSHEIKLDVAEIHSYSFAQVGLILDSLKQLFSNSRALRREDLRMPSQDNIEKNEALLNEMRQRTSQVEERLRNHIESLTRLSRELLNTFLVVPPLLGKPEKEDLTTKINTYEKLEKAITQSAIYGLTNLLFLNRTEKDLTREGFLKLVERAEQVKAALNKRLEQLKKDLLISGQQSSEDELLTQYKTALKNLFGNSFELYTSFDHKEANNNVSDQHKNKDFNSFLAAWNRSTRKSNHHFLPNRPLVLEEWLAGIGRVRTQMDLLERTLLLSELLGTSPETLHPTQLPYRENDHWIGMDLPEDYFDSHEEGEERNKLSVVFWASEFDHLPARYGGILLDEWTESIPTKDNMTGLVYNYNQPSNEAPNTILLAVTPSGDERDRNIKWEENWSEDKLKDVVLSAIEMAKMRTIEPDDILKDDFYSRLLPAILGRVMSNKENQETGISLDFGASVGSEIAW